MQDEEYIDPQDPYRPAKLAVRRVLAIGSFLGSALLLFLFLVSNTWIWEPTVDAYYPYSGSIIYKATTGGYDPSAFHVSQRRYSRYEPKHYVIVLLSPEGKAFDKYVSQADWKRLTE